MSSAIGGGASAPNPNSVTASGQPAVNSNGRYVAFVSSSGNLVAGDNNGEIDVFRRDVWTGQTVRVSVSNTGGDPVRGNVTLINLNDMPSISADGRYVAFTSVASNLLATPTSGSHVYVRDLTANTTTVVDRNLAGGPSNMGADDAGISADGRYVAFSSRSTDMAADGNAGSPNTQGYRRDLQTGAVVRTSYLDTGALAQATVSAQNFISGNGRYVVFTTAFASWRRDVDAGATLRVPIATTDGHAVDGYAHGITSDGRDVIWDQGLSGPRLHDFVTGKAESVGESAGESLYVGVATPLGISDNGRYVLLQADTTGVQTGGDRNYDFYLRDRTTATTTFVGRGGSSYPLIPTGALSADGSAASWMSRYSLVPADTNTVSDVYWIRRS